MLRLVRLSTVLSLSAAVISGVALFLVSQGVQQSEDDVYRLGHAISFEQKTENVLRAEWDYLNSPMRLEVMASEYLGMEPPVPDRVMTNTSLFPDYSAPVIPQRRPEALLTDAVYREAQKEQTFITGDDVVTKGGQNTDVFASGKVVPRPGRKPTYLERNSFNDLLDRVKVQGGPR